MVVIALSVVSEAWQATVFLAQDTTPMEELDPPTKAKVLAAFAGLIILGISMMLLTWLGARVTRRYMRGGKPIGIQPARPADDDWARPSATHDDTIEPDGE